MSNAELIIEAQDKITEILGKLERDTGQRIESIDLHEIDVTTMDDRCPRLQTSVLIRMQRTFVRDWG